MNGVSSTLKEEIKKSQQIKKREKIRFLTALLFSNALVAFLLFPSNDNIKDSSKEVKMKLHLNHQIILLKMNSLVEVPKENEAPVEISIITVGKKLLISKAYLHSHVSSDDAEERRFKIEIPESDILKINAIQNEDLIAIPYIKTKISFQKKQAFGGAKYEINL